MGGQSLESAGTQIFASSIRSRERDWSVVLPFLHHELCSFATQNRERINSGCSPGRHPGGEEADETYEEQCAHVDPRVIGLNLIEKTHNQPR